MEDRYYIVQGESHPDLRRISIYHGTSFVLVSEGVLEHIAGDTNIIQMLEVADEELRVKKDALCKYSIFSVNKTQFEFYGDIYQEILMRERSKRRVHSVRSITSVFGGNN